MARMKQLTYQLQFLNPAFLGDAMQEGSWRTPPIKTLLRQWWRVAWAAERGFALDVGRMREVEGRLFGNAWLTQSQNGRQEAAYCRSAVRLRLSRWQPGALQKQDWKPLPSFKHPVFARQVSSDLSLGYGPLVLQQSRVTLKANAAIQAMESAELRVAYPEEREAELLRALALMDRYGALGSRSRNGWGAVQLQDAEGRSPAEALAGFSVLRPWREALQQGWAHALGADETGPLVWKTLDAGDWRSCMQTLAKLKIALRTHFKFNTGRGTSTPEPRHWLSYPVTNHSVQPWGNARLPNTLRFKLRADPDKPAQLRGYVFHMPCLPPEKPFRPNARVLEGLWAEVHQFLDDQADILQRADY